MNISLSFFHYNNNVFFYIIINLIANLSLKFGTKFEWEQIKNVKNLNY